MKKFFIVIGVFFIAICVFCGVVLYNYINQPSHQQSQNQNQITNITNAENANNVNVQVNTTVNNNANTTGSTTTTNTNDNKNNNANINTNEQKEPVDDGKIEYKGTNPDLKGIRSYVELNDGPVDPQYSGSATGGKYAGSLGSQQDLAEFLKNSPDKYFD